MTDPRRSDPPERDPSLDAAWRAYSVETPPPAVDAHILAAAHREARSRPRSVGDDDDTLAEAREPSRWWWGLAAAATIGAIAFGIVQLAPPLAPMEAMTATDVPQESAKPAAKSAPTPDAATVSTKPSASPSPASPSPASPSPASPSPASPSPAPPSSAPPKAAPTPERPLEMSVPDPMPPAAQPPVPEVPRPAPRQAAPPPRVPSKASAPPLPNEVSNDSERTLMKPEEGRMGKRETGPSGQPPAAGDVPPAALSRERTDAPRPFPSAPAPEVAPAAPTPAPVPSAPPEFKAREMDRAQPRAAAGTAAPAAPARVERPMQAQPSAPGVGAPTAIPAPDAFVARIVALHAAGKLDEAARELNRFRTAHRDADQRLPKELRAWAATVERTP